MLESVNCSYVSKHVMSAVSIDFFLFQAEDGIRDLVRSRGLGDVYKRQELAAPPRLSGGLRPPAFRNGALTSARKSRARFQRCLLYTSDAADERSSVDLGGRRIIKKKKHINVRECHRGRTTQMMTNRLAADAGTRRTKRT